MKRISSGEQLVVASHNTGKLEEITALLSPFDIGVVSAAELELEEPAETGDSFADNARIKAHFVARACGLPALSDDSGIAVNALNGAPGVHTADWAETPNGRDFSLAMERLWSLLEEKSVPMPRLAAFHCTLCLAWPDGHDELFEGRVPGTLTWPARGKKGFGYDPMFVPDGETETFGEMEPACKHSMSHRARAFAKFVKECLD